MSIQETNLKAIADAIRAKTGETGTIQASKFAEKIRKIETGIPKPNQKTLQNIFPNQELATKISFCNGKFIVIQPNLTDIYQSEDGETWSSISSNFRLEAKVLYGNGVYVSKCWYNSAYSMCYSTDCSTWTIASMPSDQQYTDPSYCNGKFFTTRAGDIGAYSLDGINWTEFNFPAGGDSFAYNAVTYGNGKYVTTYPNSGKAAYSIDGINWTATSMPFAGWQETLYANGLFVAIHAGGSQFAYSIDGITWSSTNVVTSSFNEAWYGIAYGDGMFIAVSSTGIIRCSKDGMTWQEFLIWFNYYRYDIAYGNGKFVASCGQLRGVDIFTFQ